MEKLHVSLRELFEDAEFIKRIQLLVSPGVEAAVNRAMEQRDLKLAALEEELINTKESLAAAHGELTAANSKLCAAEETLEALEAYSRRNCLLINGLPELPEESTDDLVLDLARAAGVALTPGDLDRSHRLGRPRHGAGSVDRPRAIVVKLLSYNKRQELFAARKALSAHRVGDHPVLTRHVLEEVFIAEFLTTKSQHLFYTSRQLKKNGHIWAAYTTNGNVKIRKSENHPAHTIRNERELARILDIDVSALSAAASSNREATPTGQEAAAAAAARSDTAAPRSAGSRAASQGSGPGRKQLATAAAAAVGGTRKPPTSGSPFSRAVAPPSTKGRQQPPRGAGQAR